MGGRLVTALLMEMDALQGEVPSAATALDAWPLNLVGPMQSNRCWSPKVGTITSLWLFYCVSCPWGRHGVACLGGPSSCFSITTALAVSIEYLVG